jgi:hypothetical protein
VKKYSKSEYAFIFFWLRLMEFLIIIYWNSYSFFPPSLLIML